MNRFIRDLLILQISATVILTIGFGLANRVIASKKHEQLTHLSKLLANELSNMSTIDDIDQLNLKGQRLQQQSFNALDIIIEHNNSAWRAQGWLPSTESFESIQKIERSEAKTLRERAIQAPSTSHIALSLQSNNDTGNAIQLSVFDEYQNVFRTHVAAFISLQLISSVLLLIFMARRLKQEQQAIINLRSSIDAENTVNAEQNAKLDSEFTLLAPLYNALLDSKTSTGFTRQKISADNISRSDKTHETLITELQLARKTAEEANRLKNRALAKTSHELLTPLNSIVGFSELLLQQAPTNTSQQHYLSLIYDNAQHISALINDLVLYSGHSSMPLNYRQINASDTLHTIIDSLELQFQNSNIEVKKQFTIANDLTLTTDPIRFRQIVYNLLTNAINHTANGMIRINADEQRRQRTRYLRITIEDNGCGIPESEQSQIFDAFVSLSSDSPVLKSSGNAHTSLGLGLGLSIVKQLSEQLGVDIECASKVDKGTCFTLFFPLDSSLQKAERGITSSIDNESKDRLTSTNDSDETPTLPRNTLVVDDNQNNTLLLESMISSFNPSAVVDVVHGGLEALALASKRQYELIILDIYMQPMNGLETLEALRRMPEHRDAVIVACTAHTSDSEYQRLVSAGFNHILHKPLTIEQLKQAYRPKNRHHLNTIQSNEPPPLEKSIKALPNDSAKTNNGNLTSKPPLPKFDVAAAIANAGGKTHIARKIFSLLIEELSSIIREDKLSTNKRDELIERVHQLNGATAISGATEMKALCDELESRLKQDRSPKLSDITLTKRDELNIYVRDFYTWACATEQDTLFSRHQK